jgi:hypothetical protein
VKKELIKEKAREARRGGEGRISQVRVEAKA